MTLHRRSFELLAALVVIGSSGVVIAAESPMALYARGHREYEAKQFETCAGTFDQALAIATDERQKENFAYSAACCYALAAKAQPAFERLTKAIDAGFRDWKHLEAD